MIDVIMPCFNTNQEIHNLTQMAIESIRKAGDINLIIIDNGSTYAPGFLRESADVYIKNEGNKGYPAAVNQGIKVANNKTLCISNNDVRVPNNIFQVGEEILKDSRVGSVHFKMIAYDHPFEFGDKVWKSGKERWCTSSFFLIRKETVELYDENYGNGSYDDYDIWYRIRNLNGWQTAYTNKSAYQHWGSHTFQDIGDRHITDDKNLQYFIGKWGKHPEELFRETYPEQWEIPYWEGFE